MGSIRQRLLGLRMIRQRRLSTPGEKKEYEQQWQSEINNGHHSRAHDYPFVLARMPGGYLLSSTTRSYSGCVGRASCRYSFPNCSISAAVTVTGCFSTNQVTSSLQGGVVSDPENV